MALRSEFPRTVARTSALALAVAAVAAVAGPAAAQTFPDDAGWSPLACGNRPMFDPVGDDASSPGPRDLVGDDNRPAGFRAVDDDFLYLRLRVDETPGDDTGLQPFAWGFELDVNNSDDSYEVLLVAGGDTDEVSVFRNMTTTLADTPRDPPDLPRIAGHPLSSHGRVVMAAGTGIGAGPDFFLDMAVPWADVMDFNVTPATEVVMWAGSSSTVNGLDGDIACHDGSGGGAPSLHDSGSDRTTIDPDGGGNPPPPPPGGARLEGGGGCAAAGGGEGLAMLLVVAAGLGSRRRRA